LSRQILFWNALPHSAYGKITKAAVKAEILERRVSDAALEHRARPAIFLPDALIAPASDIIGDVVVGPGASLWFGAAIRGDNPPIRIGTGANIQDGAILHSDPGYPLTIGEGVTVGHRAILHGCTIGGRGLIGMGAIVLNGAEIGQDCLVGALAACSPQPRSATYFEGHPEEAAQVVVDCAAGKHRGEACVNAKAGAAGASSACSRSSSAACCVAT
jgi:carbonic anhydrase/acetyltransferase-like protein (isoleucine patch superfamily)